MFRRKVENAILEYLRGDRKKILVIDGARQIGKTYIVRKLCGKSFPNFVEINLREDYDGDKLFERIRNTRDFYLQLSALFGNSLNERDDTIVFLDEIQVYPHLLSMLKPLNQESRYSYIVSGSLLGITLKHTFIPMGSIEELKMFPMDFEEFLWANHVGLEVIEYLRDSFTRLEPVSEGIHERLLRLFKEYLICGGLPDAVKEFVVNNNVQKMRAIHDQTYRYYLDDCSQYDMEKRLIVTRIYNMMPSYMENKVKRIRAKEIHEKKNDTAANYQKEFEYLISSGIALEVKAVSNPVFPLLESSSKNLLKLYYNDVGLLTNLLYRTNIRAVLDADSGVNLGSVYETAAATELIAHGHELFYFDSKKVGEVDFLCNDYDKLAVIPIEIKSGNNQTQYRAIPKLVDANGAYRLPMGYVLGNKNIVRKNEQNLVTLPIYFISFI